MFGSLITGVGDRDTRFTVYRRDSETRVNPELRRQGVRIEYAELPPGGPEPFVVIEQDGEFTGALALSAFESLTDPPVVRPGVGEGVSRPYRVLFEALDETVFEALERRQLLAVSREIEDRAYRVGTGRLRVGFQSFSVFHSQTDVYTRLATETDLDIHVYGSGDRDPHEIPAISYHAPADDEFERYWFLAFDGGAAESQACGLVAGENTDQYEGFWTDDPEVVGDILAKLSEKA
jgi:hypothetical protein